ncbi:MAG: DUF2848 domain-containing protein [Geminicoccaceae bacterium]
MPIFERQSQSGSLLISFEATDLVMAGWTGRDPAAVQYHIDELAALNVAPPSKTPLFYRVDPALLAGSVDEIKVVGDRSSGEIEVVLLSMADGLWVGLGSDHTDRAFEAHSVQLSKQLCRKPMAETLWSYEEVIDHWDEMILRAHITEDGERVLYQEGALAEVRRPEDLISAYLDELGAAADDGLPVGTVIFCGALPAIGGIRPSTRFEMLLEDPVRDERIDHIVEIKSLPTVN